MCVFSWSCGCFNTGSW
jgi:hypothetical protein